ncbi:MAG: hypothetical protein FK733_17675 [Asgard group archaeon]|nr:hypothetical protein [Asgard group archaeon]
MVKYIIKKMARLHCARGPKRCKTCKEYAKDKKWALLDIAPDKHPMAARPMIEIEMDGEKVFMTYDVLNYFDDKKEATEYANKNNMHYEIIE